MRIFIINGIGGSGKDTFIEQLKIINKNLIIHNLSTIDPVREMVHSKGVVENKTSKVYRQLLHDTKMSWVKECDGAFNYISDKINSIKDSHSIVFIHSREVDEIARFKENFKATTILLKSNNIKNNECDSVLNQINEYKYDINLFNNFSNISKIVEIAEMFSDNIINKC